MLISDIVSHWHCQSLGHGGKCWLSILCLICKPTHCHPHRSRLVDCDFDGGNNLIGAGNIIQAVLCKLWLFCPNILFLYYVENYIFVLLVTMFNLCIIKCSTYYNQIIIDALWHIKKFGRPPSMSHKCILILFQNCISL